MSELFWFSDEQWSVLEPMLPHLGGKPREDDRRILSGVVHRFREGLRWRALPEAFGPRTTVYNRFNRWSKRGLWQELLAGLAGCSDPPVIAMIDSTAVRAHRSASGAKGGSKIRRSAARAVAGRRKSTPSQTGKAGSTP